MFGQQQHIQDAVYEVVDEGEGFGPGLAGPPLSGALSGALAGPDPAGIAAALAGLASGALRGREAQALTAVLNGMGYTRDRAQINAVVAQHGPVLNAWLGQINVEALAAAGVRSAQQDRPGVLACATDPSASLPLLALGAVVGAVLTRVAS